MNKYFCSRNKDFDSDSIISEIYADNAYQAAIIMSKEINDYNGDINTSGHKIYVNGGGKTRLFNVTVDVEPKYYASEVV